MAKVCLYSDCIFWNFISLQIKKVQVCIPRFALQWYTHFSKMKDSKGFAPFGANTFGTLSPQKGNWMADKHIAGHFRAISMIFHEPASDKMNTNKLIGKFNLGQLIISPLHCGLEKLQMTPRLMIQLTQRYMLTISNRLSWYPLKRCPLEIF